MWVAMMVAMMFPAAAPMVLLFDRVQRGRREAAGSYVPTAYFVGAYLAIWTAFGGIAFALAVGVDRLAADADWVMDNGLASAGSCSSPRASTSSPHSRISASRSAGHRCRFS
jgi:predicted metal-binding membrane protein